MMNKLFVILLVPFLFILAGCANEEEKQTMNTTKTETQEPMATPALKPSDDGLDLVLQGGGAKGLAHIGAIKELEEQERPYRRVVGTSAGSIVALFLAAGFSADDIRAAITERTPDGSIIMGSFLEPPDASEFSEEQLRSSITFRTLQDIIPDFVSGSVAEQIEMGTLTDLLKAVHYREIFSLVEAGGFSSGELFVTWLEEQLNKDGRNLGKATFAQFHAATGVDLTIVATDTTQGIMLMLNHRTAPDLPVARAVRMSSSIPFVFQEVVWQPEWGTYLGQDISGNLIVDGGMTANLPLETVVSQEPEILSAMVVEPDPERVIGLVLDHDSQIPGVIPTATPQARLNPDDLENQRIARRWQEIRARTILLADTVMNAHDYLVASTYPDHICHLPVGGMDTLEYDMNEEKIDKLLNAAQESMRNCLANINGVEYD